MVPDSRAQRHMRGLALFLTSLIVLALLPSLPSAAQGTTPDTLGNTQGSYTGGVFQRTAISKDSSTVPPITAKSQPADLEGSVQLAPIGVLKKWSPLSPPLPDAVSQAGITALNGRLYVVGGLQGGDRTPNIYRAAVEPTTGSLIGGTAAWQSSSLLSTDLLPYTNIEQEDAGRSLAGVVSLAKDASSGYIYIIGGDIDTRIGQAVSSPVVQRATVGADGVPIWTTLSNPVPVPPNDIDVTGPVGLAGASTVIARNSEGRYFLYVIGGRSIYVNDVEQTFPEYVLKSVYYSEITISDGALNDPNPATSGGVWEKGSDLALIDALSSEGLWEATASVAEVTVGNQLKTVIFLAGGAHNLTRTKLNPYIYRAEVGLNGALTWTNAPGPLDSQVTIQARRGMASLAYNSKLYLIGGRTSDASNSVKNSVPTAIFDESLDFIDIPGFEGDIFIGISDQVLETASQTDGRYNLGAAIIEAEPPAGTSDAALDLAWAYAIGGSDQGGNDTDTIFLGKIGANETEATLRAPDGWYYSEVFQASIEDAGSQDLKKARLVAIHWAAEIDRTANPQADIQIEFRKTITSNGECKPDGSDFTAGDSWSPILDDYDGADNSLRSNSASVANGLYNSVDMKDLYPGQEINASCLQYRAHLTQDANIIPPGIGDPAISPKLLAVYLEKVEAGNADLNLPDGGFEVTTVSNRLSAVKMNLRNLNLANESETVSVPVALIGNRISQTGDGSFFVNLCIARSDLGAAAPTLTLPDPSTNFAVDHAATCPYFAEIYNAEMGARTILDLTASTVPTIYGGGTRWYSNATGDPVSDIKSAFSALGQYKVGLVLDSIAGVPEESTLGESNNKSAVLAFTIAGEPYTETKVMLPFIQR